MTKTLFMETTQISPQKTAGEITTMLVEGGARQISLDYGADGQLCGLQFVLVTNGVPFQFKLPVRVEPVFKVLNGRRKWASDQTAFAAKDRAQAERVAWRQLLRWIQAQLAMVDAGMVAAREVFLPYMQDKSGQTVFELFEATRFKALPAPEVA